jgi:hypothetical protein
MNNDVSLLVGTCDRYSFLWDNFVTLCNRYWKVDCGKYFAGENLEVKHKGFYTILCGNRSWSNIMKESLKYIKTEYVFFILEDFYLSQPITEEFIKTGIDFLKSKGDANKLIFSSAFCEYYTVQHEEGKYFKMLDTSDYLTTMQPSLWKTSFLNECLKENMNPWQFEIDGTNMIKNKNNKVYIHHTDDIYFNVVNKGYIIPRWNLFKKIENLPDFKL